MAVLLHPDGSSLDVFPGDGHRFTLEELQSHVGGYYTVVAHQVQNLNGYDIGIVYVNEEGLLLDLEHNLNASTIAGKHIVGNALVLFQGEHEDEEDE